MVQRVVALLVAVLACPIVFAGPATAHHAPITGHTTNGWWDEEEPPDAEDEHADADADETVDEEPPEMVREPEPAPEPEVESDVEEPPPFLEPVLPVLPEIPVPKGKTIAGTVALVRADGKAAIPRGAPKRVRQLIAAANQIVGKPYKWGGGHARLVDRGYDCSGAVSYALIRTGLLRAPLVSGALARWGSGGAGRWISVYANRGHVYLEVAGLRLDTSPIGDRIGGKGVRWRPLIGRRRGFSARHPVGL